MSDAAGAGRVWTWLNVVLCALVVAVLVYTVVVATAGVSAVPGTSPAERAQHRYAQVQADASTDVAAFLRIDYKSMDPLQAKVLADSTGTFRKQYEQTKVNLKAEAESAKTMSTPTIRQVGVNQLNGERATVFVAADMVRSNVSTTKIKATKACPHAGATCLYFRFKIGLTLVGGSWKLSSVDFIS